MFQHLGGCLKDWFLFLLTQILDGELANFEYLTAVENKGELNSLWQQQRNYSVVNKHQRQQEIMNFLKVNSQMSLIGKLHAHLQIRCFPRKDLKDSSKSLASLIREVLALYKASL